MVLSRSLPTSRRNGRSSNSNQRNYQFRFGRMKTSYSSGNTKGVKMEDDDDGSRNQRNGSRNNRRNKHTSTKPNVHKRSHNRTVGNNRVGGRGGDRRKRRFQNNDQCSMNPPSRNQNRNKMKQSQQSSSLKPIHISSSSIHTNWKKELGGIIRYFVHSITARGIRNEQEIMEQLESLYVENGCDVQRTKNAMLDLLGGARIPKNKELDNDGSENATASITELVMNNGSGVDNDDGSNNWKWVDIQMAIEKSNEPAKVEDGLNATTTATAATTSTTQQPINNEILQSFVPSNDNKGILLKNQILNGEGSSHQHEKWTNIIIPQWAIGKSYFFQLVNKSPLDLSCEMTIDDHKVARNVPIPAYTGRMIRPDTMRYFERHQWIIQPAVRVKLQDVTIGMKEGEENNNDEIVVMSNPNPSPFGQRMGRRYNAIRPNYDNCRVSTTEYPDPIIYGWIFTGSSEKSKVEFFEKTMNLGLIKLDFYYTTGTVKTTMVHPTMGSNSLFRNTVTPDVYVEILQNPRSHTNRGYRNRSDRPADNGDLPMMEDSDFDEDDDDDDDDDDEEKIDQDKLKDNGDVQMEGSNETPLYARNDNYDFDNEGHTNRATAMSKLEKTSAYGAWEDAARKEWACIHAKFYISLPNKRYQNRREENGQRGKIQEQEDLPQQAPIVDVKAAEKATLGTKFYAIGASEPRKRSNVTMKRINGLNDSDEYRAAPIFEYKLYYRAENKINEIRGDDYDDEQMDEYGQVEEEEGKSERKFMSQTLNMNVEEYKKERIHQITKWHQTNKCPDVEEANFVLENRINFLNASETIGKIDAVVEEYYQWFQRQQWK